MDKQTRRQQSADYKRQEVQSGIYQIHCTATDARWAGIALNLSAIRNRLWFGLRQGSHPHGNCSRPGQRTVPTHSSGSRSLRWKKTRSGRISSATDCCAMRSNSTACRAAQRHCVERPHGRWRQRICMA